MQPIGPKAGFHPIPMEQRNGDGEPRKRTSKSPTHSESKYIWKSLFAKPHQPKPMKRISSFAIFALLMGLTSSTSLIAADTKSSLDKMDEKFVKSAAADCHSEVLVAELGTKKAASDSVKAIAVNVAKAHTALHAEITALAKAKAVELSSANDPKADEAVADLEKESGKSFDKAFLTHLKKTHDATLKAYESAANDCKDAELKAWVKQSLPTLKAHLDSINKALKSE